MPIDLNDPRWLGLGVSIFAFIVSLLGLYLPHRRHPKKKLSYEILLNQPLVSVDKLVEKRVKVLFDDGEVPDVQILVIKFTNIGNTTITLKDYVTPVKISLGKEAKILQGGVGITTPKDLPVNASIKEHHYLIESVMLNPGYSVPIVIYATKVSDIDVTGIIEGVKTINNRVLETHPLRYRNRPNFFKFLFVFSTTGVMLLLLGLRKWAQTPIFLAFSQLMFLFMTTGIFYIDILVERFVKNLQRIQRAKQEK